MRLALHVPIALLLLLPAFVATAEHTTPACATPYHTIDADDATLYLVPAPDHTWLYLETNGHPDLQRGGSPWYHVGTEQDWYQCWDIVTATGEPVEEPDMILL